MQKRWTDLPKPIMCLAPMEEVTDTVFRQLLCEIGKPDLMFSEFINVQHIFSHGSNSAIDAIEYQDFEKPLVLQLWGNEPELYHNAADMAVNLGYDGVDINMGCPQPKIIKQAACSALINNRQLASEIIKATQAGVKGRVPVSVKTRIGFKSVITEDWLGFLLEHNLDAITVHGRTSAQLSLVPADWSEIGKVVKLRDRLNKKTIIIGNGDVTSLAEAKIKVDHYGVDGVMIGRGIFHNPWLFNKNVDLVDKSTRLKTLLRHIQIWQNEWNNQRYYEPLKRFFKIYCQGFPYATELRVRLMTTNSVDEVIQVLESEIANAV